MIDWRGPNETRDPLQANEARITAVAASAMLVGTLWFLVWLVAQATGTGHDAPTEWTRAWFDDRRAWSGLGTLLGLMVVGVLVTAAAVLVRRFDLAERYLRWKVRRRIDQKARVLSGREDELELRAKAAQRFARSVGVPAEFPPGLSIGRSVAFGTPLWINYELTSLVIKGPRQGKTTSLVVPQVVSHAGPVLQCSNKRDLHDQTRGPRSRRDVVWVHDMQQIAQQAPEWWWDPLSFIRGGEDKASRAARLAGAWQACHAAPGSATDAYFGPGGESLLANLLLAAALAGKPAPAALEWLGDLHARDTDLPDPVVVLRSHGFTVAATELESDRELTPKQLDGLVGTARGILSFLREETFRPWITPDPDRREFRPQEFVRSSQTLTLLSKNTKGPSGRAIVTALTMAVTDAALQLAQRSQGGRLRSPLLLMLDEAANICPWPELPDLYSYLGSHGVIPVTILQNYAQGVKAWKEEGMKQLVSSANVMLIGGGINDTGHLRDLVDLVDLIGQRSRMAATTNRGRKWDSRSTGRSVQKEEIFTISDLRAWPPGRVITFASGSRPIITKMIPWHAGPHAQEIRDSEDFYSPSATSEGLWADEVDVSADQSDPAVSVESSAPRPQRRGAVEAEEW